MSAWLDTSLCICIWVQFNKPARESDEPKPVTVNKIFFKC